MTTDTTTAPAPAPKPREDFEAYRERKRIEREERLDRFERDSDYRTRDSWPL
jgi:hypothetical protein